MKYTIISINDDRKAYKDIIRDRVGLEEIQVPAFNAYDSDPLVGIASRGLVLNPIWTNVKRGELGVWLSNINAWEACVSLKHPLVVFEDDAVPNSHFDTSLQDFCEDLPYDWDFVALWVPENQRQDYLYDVEYNEFGHPRFKGWVSPEDSIYRIPDSHTVAKVYQGYGMVAMMYSPRGAKKLLSRVKHRGIDTPVDCWIYEEAHKGELAGYAPRPDFANLVHYDWQAVSHVQGAGVL